jgi:hypothetical protein
VSRVTWIRSFSVVALIAGLIYLISNLRLQIELTRFVSESGEQEPFILPILWIWSPIPIALFWCALAFYGATIGMRLGPVRWIVLIIGLLALATVVAFVLVLMLPQERRV